MKVTRKQPVQTHNLDPESQGHGLVFFGGKQTDEEPAEAYRRASDRRRDKDKKTREAHVARLLSDGRDKKKLDSKHAVGVHLVNAHVSRFDSPVANSSEATTSRGSVQSVNAGVSSSNAPAASTGPSAAPVAESPLTATAVTYSAKPSTGRGGRNRVAAPYTVTHVAAGGAYPIETGLGWSEHPSVAPGQEAARARDVRDSDEAKQLPDAA